MVEFEQNGQVYRAGKLDAFKQLHLSRRLAPLIPKLVPAFIKLQTLTQAKGADGAPRDLTQIADVVTVLGPFADALAELTDEATEQIVRLCLGVVQRQQGNSWAALMNPQGVLMFSDLEFGDMLPIMIRVIRENLGNFIAGLLPPLPVAAPAEAG